MVSIKTYAATRPKGGAVYENKEPFRFAVTYEVIPQPAIWSSARKFKKPPQRQSTPHQRVKPVQQMQELLVCLRVSAGDELPISVQLFRLRKAFQDNLHSDAGSCDDRFAHHYFRVGYDQFFLHFAPL